MLKSFYFIIGFIVLQIQGALLPVFAENIIFEGDKNTSIIIDGDNTSSNETLYFGDNLNKFLQWDFSNQNFIFSDDVTFSGGIQLNGKFLDENGEEGLSGQVLSSTESGTSWVTVSSQSGSVIPSILSEPLIISKSSTTTVIIEGENFTPSTGVSIPGFTGTINSTDVISSTEININITSTSTEANYDVVVSNGEVLNTLWTGNGVGWLTVGSSWVDLRAGGNPFTHGNAAGNDIRYRSGMSMLRDANGMYFNGASPWRSWVKFESLGWTRGADKTLSWIITNPTSAMMIGIGSSGTNESSSAQYYQAEVQSYINSTTSVWGFYGNSGSPGSGGSQSDSSIIPSGGVYRFEFHNDGGAGGAFKIYKLPSASSSDWSDTSNLIKSSSIGGSINPSQSNIMPFITPNTSSSQRFIAVMVE